MAFVELTFFKNELMGHIDIDHGVGVDAFGMGDQPEVLHLVSMEEKGRFDIVLDLTDPLQNILQILHNKLNGDQVVLATGHNQIRKVHARLDKLDITGLDESVVLFDDALGVSATFSDISQNSSGQSDVIIAMDENLKGH